MRYPFCTTLCDDETGVVLVYDIECELDAEPDGNGVDILGVYVEGTAIHSSQDHLTQWVCKRVIDAAEKDIRFVARVQEGHADTAWEREASEADAFHQFMRESAI